MSSILSTDVRHEQLNCRIDGPAHAPVVVLSNSLGADLSMWDEQLPALTQRFRVLRYDARGHGASSVTPGPYTVAQLGRDVLWLLDGLKIERAHFCGISLGGMTGMWLALHAADRIDKLVLANTAPKIGTTDKWTARIENVRKGGLEAIADGLMELWFTPGFRQRSPDRVTRVRAMLAASPPDGYIAACAAVRDADLREPIRAIQHPTLVIAATHDLSVPTADSRALAAAIAGARYVELDAAHISNIEAAGHFTAELAGFLPG